jgi:hypothetical protein
MKFDDFDDLEIVDSELADRLSPWRRMPSVVAQSALKSGETSVNIEEVRTRQRRIATMCSNTVQVHDAFVASLKDFIAKSDRDPSHQQRVEDEAAFALGVCAHFLFEQTSALCLESGIQRELEGLPKEIIQTVYVSPPTPPKSFLQRVLGI